MKNICATCPARTQDDYGDCVFAFTCTDLFDALTIETVVSANVAASREAREASRFLDPENDDALSLTVGWVRDVWSQHAEGADADAGFDGGEFSGPAHDALAHDEIAFLKQHYFEFSGVDFDREVISRVGLDVAMKLDVLTTF